MISTTQERRKTFVERFECPFCLATRGSPCEMQRNVEEGCNRVPHALYHVGRFKRAAGAAIDQLVKSDGVTYDDASAVDEAEIRATSFRKLDRLIRDARTVAQELERGHHKHEARLKESAARVDDDPKRGQ